MMKYYALMVAGAAAAAFLLGFFEEIGRAIQIAKDTIALSFP